MYIPKNAKLEDVSSGKIMDYVRQEIGGEYSARVPMVGNYDQNGDYVEGTLEGLQSVGNILLSDSVLYNQFAKFLPNRIGRVLIQSRLFRNPLEAFKMGYMETGDVIEEIFVQIVRSRQFNPDIAEKEMLKREIPDIPAAFHHINVKLFYKLTISYDMLRGAFTSWNGVRDLVGRIIEQAYTSANYDEYILFKYVIARAILNKTVYPITVPEVNKANASDVVTEMVAASNMLPFFSDQYNAMGVPTFTNKENQITLINAKFSALRDVNVLATAFNMDKAELQGRVIMIDGFGFNNLEIERLKFMNEQSSVPFLELLTEDDVALLNTIPALTIDDKFFVIIDQLFELKNFENGEGLYWNYWLHTWKCVDYSPFANAIAFTTTESTATVNSITPATKSMAKGSTAQFTASVTATGFASDSVTWTLTSADTTSSPVSSIVDINGNVTIAADEQNSKLTLTAIAKSNVDSFKTATITVTG